LPQVVDRLVDADDVVVDVAEVEPRVLGDELDVEAYQPVAHLDQRRDGALEAHQVALEVVDALGRRLGERPAEDRLLEPLELVLERVDDREVAVDDEVHEGVEDEPGALAEQAGRALAARPDLGVRQGRPVADGEDVARADEDVRLAEGDLAAAVSPLELAGAEPDEERLAVLLELRPLVGAERVLD